MKNKIVKLAVITFIAGSMFSACQTSAQKVESARIAAEEAQQNLAEAQQDSISEYKQFKKDAEEKIVGYDKRIADLKARIVNEKKVNKAKYEKKLAELEKKNSETKKKLAEYKETSKEEWTNFKTEFNRDMDEMGTAIENFLIKNDN
jgi:regulator of protease activity HflC (stomatin/prohibitin superfamily)